MQVASVLAILSIILYLTGWGYIFGYLNYFGVDSNLIDLSFQKIIISNIYLYEHIKESMIAIIVLSIIIVTLAVIVTFGQKIKEIYFQRMYVRAVFTTIAVAVSLTVIFFGASQASSIGEKDAKTLHEWLLSRPGAIKPSRIPQTVDIYETSTKSAIMRNLGSTFYMLGQNGSVIFVIGVFISDGGRFTRVIAIPYNSIHNLQLDALQKRSR